MNKAILTGRLTKDPELRHTQSNVPVTSFTIAVDRRFKNANGERESDFISCIAWRQQAEVVARYFTKGRMISVVGSIQTRKYVDRDGNNRVATEVVAEEIYFCGDRDRSEGASAPQGQTNSAPSAPNYARRSPEKSPEPDPMGQGFYDENDEDDDELPF